MILRDILAIADANDESAIQRSRREVSAESDEDKKCKSNKSKHQWVNSFKLGIFIF